MKESKATSQLRKVIQTEIASVLSENKYSVDEIKKFIATALKKAGIKVKKIREMKPYTTRAVYGAFYFVKSEKYVEETLPFYVYDNDKIELGISTKGFWPGKIGEMSKVVKNLKDFKKTDLDEALDPYKDFGSDQYNDEYDLNLGSFVDHYQKLMKFMKKHKEVPDKNKREWALAIRKKVGQSMFNGHMSQMRNMMDLLQMGEKYRNLKESVLKENPAVIATAARTAIQNAQGKNVSVNYARQPKYAKVDKAAHNKAKSLFQKIKDKFKKKDKKDEPKQDKSAAQKYADLYGGGAKVESTFRVKVDAYQDVMNALDKYISILKKQGIQKKAKLAMQMLKNLQKSFFAKEGFKEVAMPAKEKQVQAIKSISQLISIAAGEEAKDVFERPKPSEKALKAALKLVNKVK